MGCRTFWRNTDGCEGLEKETCSSTWMWCKGVQRGMKECSGVSSPDRNTSRYKVVLQEMEEYQKLMEMKKVVEAKGQLFFFFFLLLESGLV